MTILFRQADELLRDQRAPIDADRPQSLVVLARTLVVFGAFYGSVMGTFGGLAGDRIAQVAVSAAKVPFLLLATFALSVPNFYVLNALLGLASDFRQAFRALLATQAGLTVILASFAPFTAFWYASSANYDSAVLFNALMFGLASLGAQGMLRRGYRPLIARNPRHRVLLRAWVVIYAFVGVQMGWLLRPFIGSPYQPVQFFRSGAWDNAYVVVVRLIWETLTR
jgi:hypothetical protein